MSSSNEQSRGATPKSDAPKPPPIITFGEILATLPDPVHTLLGRRFLCRGGSVLLVGPSGIGKSSIVMQVGPSFSLGREAFGIKPARPLRVLVIQAEDDMGDLNEMAVGITEGLKLTNREIALCKERCHFVFENSRTGMEFINSTVAPLLEQGQYDLVIINPLQAYLGGDVKDVEKTVLFLRNGLNPLLTKFGVGLILVHHTPKIIFRGDTTEWRASDWMYAGAGAADITNWTRGAVVIDATMNPKVFKFIAAKRGMRIGWNNDLTGEHELVRYFAHGDNGNIFWRDASEDEAQSAKDAPRGAKDIFQLVPEEGSISKDALISKAGGLNPPIGKHKAGGFIEELIADKILFEWRIRRPGKVPAAHVARYAQPCDQVPR